MKKLLLLISLLLFLAKPSFAQNTAVTATVVDPGINAYGNGNVTITFVPLGLTNPNVYRLNGAPFTQTYAGTTSVGGFFSVSLPDNNIITPSGSQWQFQICSFGNTCFTRQLIITGINLDVSGALSAAAPPILGFTFQAQNPWQASQIPTRITAAAAQSAPLFQITDWVGNVLFAVAANGNVTCVSGCSGGGGGSSIFTSFQLGNNTPITGSGNYTQLTATAPLVWGAQTGNGASITPFIIPITCPTCNTSAASVTSVGITQTGTVLTITNTPITTSGNINLAFANESANTFFAGPNGATGAPTFRAMVSADVPPINLAAGGNGGVTGNLPPTNLNGGTGASNVTFWRGDGTWASPTGSGTVVASPQFGVAYYTSVGTSNTVTGLNAPTTPNGAIYTLVSIPSGGVASPPIWQISGVGINAQVGTSYTVLFSDRASVVTYSNAGAITVTIPDAGSANFGNSFVHAAFNIGASLVTYNRTTTSTINGATSQIVPTKWFALEYSDNTNYVMAVMPTIAAFPNCPTNALGFTAATGIFVCNSAGGGAVTSVGLQINGGASSGIFTVSGSPVTTTGNLNYSLSGTSGGITYFSSTTVLSSSGILNTNILVKGGGAGAAPTNSSITDNGTTVSTTEPVQLGAANCTVFGTSGGFCATEGTQMTNVSGTMAFSPDSTLHEILVATNGDTNFGMLVRRQPGAINQTAKTAAITTATLCAANAGECNVAGQYHLHFNFWGSGTACSSVTAGSVTFLLTWTDENAVSHSAVALQMATQSGAATTAAGSSFLFQTALANESAGGDYVFSTNGTVIQYATGYTACTTGTGTYNLRASITRLQ